MATEMNRRGFLGAGAAAGLTFIPSHALRGQGGVAPSDKITVAYIGCGTEGHLELMAMLTIPEIQVVAVCDPVKFGTNYNDFSSDRVTAGIRTFLGKPDWGAGRPGIPGGRDLAKEVIESYYAQFRPNQAFRGVNTYADFRELLEKEKDLNAVKIMTPDHLHAAIGVAAMKKGKHTIVHKPISNRMEEANVLFETARKTGVATFFMPWRISGMDQISQWIRDGAIGTLREIHNWTDRPYWPQWPSNPADRPPIPQGFDWDLWLGPVPNRPYHPNYTHMLFRGWYDFGGGSMADMGHYSLCPVFHALKLPSAIAATPRPVTEWALSNQIAARIRNDVSYPPGCSVQFKLPAANGNPPIDLYWYDGGLRPPEPPELAEDNRQLAITGLMFVGDKGKILDGRIIPESRMKSYLGAAYTEPGAGRGGRGGQGAGRGGQNAQAGAQPAQAGQGGRNGQGAQTAQAASGRGRGAGQASGMGGADTLGDWIKAVKGGPQAPGNFLDNIAITETFNLGYIALRANQHIEWDPVARRITNNASANQLLTREYRPGWEPKA